MPKTQKSRFHFFDRFRTIFADFEKWNFQYVLWFVFFQKNLHKSIKSDVSDTNGRRNRDFRVETVQNEVGEVYFRCKGTHFMTFSDFLIINSLCRFVWFSQFRNFLFFYIVRRLVNLARRHFKKFPDFQEMHKASCFCLLRMSSGHFWMFPKIS